MAVRWDDEAELSRFAVDDPGLPERFQQYILNKNKLGVGPISFCYQATRIDSNSPVRLKVLRSRICNLPGLFEVFEKLEKVSAVYSGENILQFHGSGRHDNILYYEFDYVDAVSLRTLIGKEAPFHPDLAMLIAEGIVAGLSQIHGARPSPGMGNLIPLHRNLKPENVLITREGLVKVTDINLIDIDYYCSNKDVELPHDSRCYEAPEQLLRSGYADRRSDIYSLGMVILEMVSGKVPFWGRDIYESRQNVREKEGEKISRFLPKSKDKTRKSLTKALVSIIKKMIHHNPERRLQRLADFEDWMLNYFEHSNYHDRQRAIAEFVDSRYFQVQRERKAGFLDRLFHN